MGKTTRRKFPPEFKAKVALEALKESSTKGDFAKQYEISPEMISRWKKELVENASAAFGAKSDTADFDKERDALQRKIGELEMDVDFASGYTSSWGYLYPKDTDISNERGCRQGREASPVSEQSPPEQTAWDSQKHILLQAQGRRKPEKSEDDGPHG